MNNVSSTSIGETTNESLGRITDSDDIVEELQEVEEIDDVVEELSITLEEVD